MGYRDAAPERRRLPEVVSYRPMPWHTRLAGAAVMLGMSVFMLFMALKELRSTELECVRGGRHTCTIVRHYGLLTTNDAIPINTITSVTISAHSGKNSTTYSADLMVRGRGVVALMRGTKRAVADALKLQIERHVFAREPGTASLPLESPSMLGAVIFGVMAVGVAALSILFNGSARLEFDFDRDQVRYQRRHWPLPAVRRTFRGSDVTRAEVTSRPGSKGGTVYEVALKVAKEGDVPLVGGGGANRQHNKDAADKINRILGRMHDEADLIGFKG